MSGAAIVFAFSAGMLASVNPCGFAMLPTFITYYLSSGADREEAELNERLLRALELGLMVTAGFLVVFVIAGAILSAGGHALVQAIPWIGVLVGVLLVILGVLYLLGRNIVVPIPIPEWEFRTQGPRGMFLYGVAYAAVSLSCTLPVFLSVFATSLSSNDWLSTSALFLAFSLGMGVVVYIGTGNGVIREHCHALCAPTDALRQNRQRAGVDFGGRISGLLPDRGCFLMSNPTLEVSPWISYG